ncbi:MAG: winged helix-turn-helix domain-containing protein [Candidatus Heimdallarchaeota archaeon]
MLNPIQREILNLITKNAKEYPVTINDLVKQLGKSNSLIHRHTKKLEEKGLIESKRVVKTKGGETFYKTLNTEWPKNLGKKCFDCQNKGSNARCTFHNELAELEKGIRPDREGVELTKNTYACGEGFIERRMNWRRKRLEEFLEENRRITETENGLKISYHCANENCKAELPILGDEFIAKIGSSVIRCEECNSFYKTIYNKKKNAFYVHYNIENGKEYKRNFLRITKEIEPEGLYSSDTLGIVIHDLREININFRMRTLAVNNWVGKLTDIEYIVAKKEEDRDYLEELLPAKGYEKIDIILGADELISPPPIKQNVGMLRLLRETLVANKDFCISMLRNRITIIKRIHGLFNREKEFLVKESVKTIEQLIIEVKGRKWITSTDWNYFEMRGGNAMWGVIKAYLAKLGVEFPGRGKCRLVTDPSLPHRRFYAYSNIDTLINGIFGIVGDYGKEYCNEINLCWDGYPGLCHEKTKRGVLGFHFDLKEPSKLLPIPNLIEAIKDGQIEIKNVPYFRGRNREKIYYVKKGTELEEQMREVVEEMKRGIVNGKRGKEVVREQYRQGKQWLKDMYRRSNYYEIKHHGADYQPWAIMKEKVWEMMGKEERSKLMSFLRKEHQKTKFRPLTIMELN